MDTIFEDSAISIDKWMIAVWMICNCKNGISSYELARTIGVTQKSAWFMLHRIREAMKDGNFLKIGGNGSPVEIDETYIGPKPQAMHKQRRNLRKFGGKAIVMGLLERGSQVRAGVIPRSGKAELHSAIQKHVEHGAWIVTDDFPAYYGIDKQYVHDIIVHSMEYVRGHIHTQGIENFWSLLKRGLRGTYVAVEPFHLDRYVTEQVFRYNNRSKKDRVVTDNDRFSKVMNGVFGKRLTYSELTGQGAN